MIFFKSLQIFSQEKKNQKTQKKICDKKNENFFSVFVFLCFFLLFPPQIFLYFFPPPLSFTFGMFVS